MTDWGTQFIGMCSKKCKVAWDKYANKHATVAQVKLYRMTHTRPKNI